MSLFNVDPSIVSTQATTYSQHASLLSAEKSHADAKVNVIKFAYSKLQSSHSKSIQAFSDLLKRMMADVKTLEANIAKAKAELAAAQAKAVSLKTKSDEARRHYESGNFVAFNTDGSAAGKKDRAENAWSTAKAQADGIQIGVETGEHNLAILKELVEKAKAEVAKTFAAQAKVQSIISHISTYESQNVSFIGLTFRAWVMGGELQQFAAGVERNDSSAEANLLQHLPDKNWYGSKEAKDLQAFFHSTDAGAMALKKIGAAKTLAGAEAEYLKANPRVVLEEKADAIRIAGLHPLKRQAIVADEKYMHPLMKKINKERMDAAKKAEWWGKYGDDIKRVAIATPVVVGLVALPFVTLPAAGAGAAGAGAAAEGASLTGSGMTAAELAAASGTSEAASAAAIAEVNASVTASGLPATMEAQAAFQATMTPAMEAELLATANAELAASSEVLSLNYTMASSSNTLAESALATAQASGNASAISAAEANVSATRAALNGAADNMLPSSAGASTNAPAAAENWFPIDEFFVP